MLISLVVLSSGSISVFFLKAEERRKEMKGRRESSLVILRCLLGLWEIFMEFSPMSGFFINKNEQIKSGRRLPHFSIMNLVDSFKFYYFFNFVTITF